MGNVQTPAYREDVDKDTQVKLLEAPSDAALNGICPYFTMFPLEFPLGILERRAGLGERVLDPFCGRGTTNYAARLAGLDSLGVDSSPVAVAITAAKLVKTSADEIAEEARNILAGNRAVRVPSGEFWDWAFHPSVLGALCQMREAFLEECGRPARIALRGIVLGALHGPKQKSVPGYFSNQCPRTYAPKPAYSVRFWKEHGLMPERVDTTTVIKRRADRYYGHVMKTCGKVVLGDSRKADALALGSRGKRFDWIITSPPYYGMRTYIPDQWLRNWFVGGADTVDYSSGQQIGHSSPESFAADLRSVWKNAARVSSTNARLVIRFGGIADRNADPLDIAKDSLADSGWRITTIKQAGTATEGKRQANAFLRTASMPLEEFDIWAVKR